MGITFNEKVIAFFKCRKNYADLLGYCNYLIGDLQKAKDATQETFLRLIEKAGDPNSKIKFPEDAQEFCWYVKTAARNFYLGNLRTYKGFSIGLDSNTENLQSENLHETNFKAWQKLENLHMLIVKSEELFTAPQLLLWQCMYECKPIREIESILGKEKQTVYSLKNKLKAKIKSHFTLEMLNN